MAASTDPLWEEYYGNSADIYGGIDWAAHDFRVAEGQEAQRRYDTALAERAPYVYAGHEGVNLLRALMAGDKTYQDTPDYKAGLEAGMNALERGLAARRGLFSGRAGKEMLRFGEDYQAQKKADEFLRLYKMAYSPPPFTWHPTGGAPDFKSFADYAGMYPAPGGGGGGGGGGTSAPGKDPRDQGYGITDSGNVITGPSMNFGGGAGNGGATLIPIGTDTNNPNNIPPPGPGPRPSWHPTSAGWWVLSNGTWTWHDVSGDRR